MRERKLKNCVYCQGALKQKDEKQVRRKTRDTCTTNCNSIVF